MLDVPCVLQPSETCWQLVWWQAHEQGSEIASICMVTTNNRVEPDFSEIISPVAACGESEQVDISNTDSQAASYS